MGSLLDKLNANPPVPVAMSVFAVDPGLDVLGWARITIRATKPLMAAPQFSDVVFGLLESGAPKGSRDVVKAQCMVAAIARHFHPYLDPCDMVVVEGQQVYYKDDENRDAVVAKANDLLRLAQVMGAMQMLAAVHQVPCTQTPLPAEWKGQADKRNMHDDASKALEGGYVSAYQLGTPRAIYVGPLVIDSLPKRMHHGLDALCMAMIMGERKLRQDVA
jgi:hypothetical protein